MSGASMPSLLHIFPSFGIGGAQRRTVDLANTILAEKRHIIVALDRDFSAAEALHNNVRHRLVSLGCKPSHGLDFAKLRMFRRLVVEHRPKMLITYNWGSIEAALANRLAPLCPHLHFEDGFGPDEASGRQLPRRIWARRLALSGRSTIVVPSKTLWNLARRRWRFRSKRLCYIPNGIDCERFEAKASDSAPPLRRHADEILIGTVGTLRPEKNVGRMLRVFAALRSEQPLRLAIVGDGPERPRLEAEAAELGIADRVLFAGQQRSPESMLQQLDIFALTSDTEQMPYCLIEAMASGLPVVVTDVGDVRSMLPAAHHGFIAAQSDEGAFADRLSGLIDDPQLRRRLGDLNRSHAREHFGREAMLNSYIDLFSSVLPA